MIGPNEQQEAKPDFQSLVDQSVVEGVSGGILRFMRHHKIDTHPSKKYKEPLEAFIGRLLSEYTPDPAGYPFKDSFKDFLIIRVAEAADTIKALYDAGEIKNCIGVSRLEGGAAIAEFLEAHKDEVIKIIQEIRGE